IAINGLYLYLKNWKYKKSKAGVLLLGPAGSGKTSSTYAIANELGYTVTELNASDTRAKKALRDKLGIASEFKQIEDEDEITIRERIILMDEIDGISGQKDRGGLPEFIKILKKSMYPIVCTANDPESDKIVRISKELRVFVFERLDEFEIFDLLSKIARIEEFQIEDEMLEEIAENAGGDVRAAINELESHFHGSSEIMLEKRDKMVVLSELFNQLFQSKDYLSARKAMSNAPSDYYPLLLQLFDHTSKQCRTPQELVTAYDQIALADLTLARIMQTQDWSQLKHFFTYIGPGIALSRDPSYFTRIRKVGKYPSAFQVRGIAKRKSMRALKLAPTVAPRLHMSQKRFVQDEFHLFSKIVLGKNGAEVAAWLNLDDDQIDALQKINPKSSLADDIEEARIKIGAVRLKQGMEIAKDQSIFDDDIIIHETEKKKKRKVEEKDFEDQIEEVPAEGQRTLDDFFE
ncbi:MAG: AAA family ATPase, partial [Candidatus Kariarchaeaceae archaeon]